MKVQIIQGHDHSLAASHIKVVIDVIRAFTVAHYAFINGVKEIVLAGTVEEALRFKEQNPEFVLAGEVKGLAIPGFEIDNSPARLLDADLQGKTLIQKTTNGVAATLHSLNAGHVFVTGFTNARTTAAHIKRNLLKEDDMTIHLIASHPSGDDDLACAEYMAGILQGTYRLSADQAITRIQQSVAAEKFYDEDRPEFVREDISLCTKELPSDFVMRVNVHRDGIPLIQPFSING